MNAEQLKSLLNELVVLLEELDRIIPNKIDDDIITFFRHVQENPWVLELLLNALLLSRGKSKK